ncbi:MAG: hydantoinase/oxoprolinase family protein [Lachnospiraceae bacterium]|nr:hydantoinase/oxoprolinase family protein [Lachnospiraceae bacterium]
MLAVGIDTGGTCTDAVLYDPENKKIYASAKSETTHRNLEEGIGNSLKKLPFDEVKKASYISLSTTLATNACVENKGGRVCLIFIGVNEKTVNEVYEEYGFENMDDMVFLKGNARSGREPDWDEFDKLTEDIIKNYDSVAVSQIYANQNNGAWEKKIADIIGQKSDMPVVCAYDIFQDLNVIKRGAGAMLNARLIPVIDRFFAAVEKVLTDMNLKIPYVIMKSDGSLVSKEYTKRYPVETLVCGPTASVKGGMELMGSQDALIIDMGGTTTDVAMVREGKPVLDTEGIKVGNWQTFVKGIDIDTFALGGDTQVCFKNDEIFLGNRRVMSLCALASKYPSVLDELKDLKDKHESSSRPLHEHLILMTDPALCNKEFTEEEHRICEVLKDGPLGIRQVAERIRRDVYFLNTKRLESEGILLRSGLTPTDIMILKGDFKKHSPEAAEYALSFVASSTGRDKDEVREEIYELVKERLYVNLVRFLANRLYSENRFDTPAEKLEFFSMWNYRHRNDEHGNFLLKGAFSTGLELVGVGAPTHVFLPDVAKLLGTKCLLSEYSGVSNALGAMLGEVVCTENVHIRVEYLIAGTEEDGILYHVYCDREIVTQNREEAEELAKKESIRRARERAEAAGAVNIYNVETTVTEDRGKSRAGSILLEITVSSTAHGKLFN